MLRLTELLSPLLADQHAIRNIARGMQSHQSHVDVGDLTKALLFFCLFFVSVWGVARLVPGKERAAVCLNPGALFRALCRAHQLGRFDRSLLKQLARAHQLEQPALLFVEPARFDTEALGEAFRRQRDRIAGLRARLFAELADIEPAKQ